MISFIKQLFGWQSLDYADLIQRGVIIIDVRSVQEFAQGNAEQSINIPLGEIGAQLEKIKKNNKPIITCCRSGTRSGIAANLLKKHEIEVYNGGSWNKVQQNIKKNSTAYKSN